MSVNRCQAKECFFGNANINRSFFSCLLQSNFRDISANNLNAVLGRPYGIVSGSTADIQDIAT